MSIFLSKLVSHLWNNHDYVMWSITILAGLPFKGSIIIISGLQRGERMQCYAYYTHYLWCYA